MPYFNHELAGELRAFEQRLGQRTRRLEEWQTSRWPNAKPKIIDWRHDDPTPLVTGPVVRRQVAVSSSTILWGSTRTGDGWQERDGLYERSASLSYERVLGDRPMQGPDETRVLMRMSVNSYSRGPFLADTAPEVVNSATHFVLHQAGGLVVARTVSKGVYHEGYEVDSTPPVEATVTDMQTAVDATFLDIKSVAVYSAAVRDGVEQISVGQLAH